MMREEFYHSQYGEPTQRVPVCGEGGFGGGGGNGGVGGGGGSHGDRESFL